MYLGLQTTAEMMNSPSLPTNEICGNKAVKEKNHSVVLASEGLIQGLS